MFDKDTYSRRRRTLLSSMKEKGQKGIALFIGNDEAPAQYKDNCYKFRQDSSWLYYFGLDEPGMAAIIDLEDGTETVYADDVDIDDIIWMGPQPSVQSKAESAGVMRSAPAGDLAAAVGAAMNLGRPVHFLPPTRHGNTIKLMELTGLSKARVNKVAPMDCEKGSHASQELVDAVIAMRLVKEECEIKAIDEACDLGYEMHTAARNAVRPGIVEQEVVGIMEGITLGKGWGISFPTILTQHGETLHNHLHDKIIEPGKLLVIDAGAESNVHYASDFTRTLPTGGRFTPRQRDIYSIVCDCNEFAFSIAKPGITYREVHIETSRKMLEGLKDLGLVRGSVDDMVAEGIAGLFMPHGLGHNMGLDVHDMEDLGEDRVGYDPDQKRASQLGLGSLRMARRLVPGHVVTDEPGIYFIPALMAKWKADGTGKDFVNFAKAETYSDFGGIRLEDDLLVTENGVRRTGTKRLPIFPDDVEESMKQK